MVMKVEKRTIALTAEHAEALRNAVENGSYASHSEVVRDALRLWQERLAEKHAALENLGRLWDEGIASGTAGVLNIADIKARARKIAGIK